MKNQGAETLNVKYEEAAQQHSRSYSRCALLDNEHPNTPIGIKLIAATKCINLEPKSQRILHKSLVIMLTFLAYAAFHVGRRPLSVVKNVLHRNCSDPSQNPNNGSNCENWAPFDDDETANLLLALVDAVFLATYAIALLFSGYIAERVNLRHFMTIGCLISALGLFISGLARPLQIHSLSFFFIAQLISGIGQSTGWPVVVTCVSNWFSASDRGLVYGIWNSHTNVGNILGALIAGYYVNIDWGLSFMAPAVLMVIMGFILLLFLVPHPRDVNMRMEDSNEDEQERKTRRTSVDQTETSGSRRMSDLSRNTANFGSITDAQDSSDNNNYGNSSLRKEKAVSLLKAARIPGVIEFSACLFFSKLVNYTFLYWLPKYIAASTSSGSKESAYQAIWFDVGGVLGGILAGFLSDKLHVNGLICAIMLILAIPAMFLYEQVGSINSIISTQYELLLQGLAGLLISGPYCLITTAVSADLGNRLKDGHAVATVTALVDATGSVGAVVGPFLAGLLSSTSLGWQGVFYMLIVSNALAALCLARIAIAELRYIIFGNTSNIHHCDP